MGFIEISQNPRDLNTVAYAKSQVKRSAMAVLLGTRTTSNVSRKAKRPALIVCTRRLGRNGQDADSQICNDCVSNAYKGAHINGQCPSRKSAVRDTTHPLHRTQICPMHGVDVACVRDPVLTLLHGCLMVFDGV